MADVSRWIVTLDGTLGAADVVRALTARGFEVESVLDAAGCIVGRADAAIAGAIGTLPGVAAVEPDADVSIGPPGHDPSW